MLGSIAGDIIGSTYEILNTKKKDFNLFRPFSRYTDDTVLTIATADCILHDGDFGEYYRRYCIHNQMRGYGSRFYAWALFNKKKPNNSMGNGCAMRATPIGYAFSDIDSVMRVAEKSAISTHNHSEGIKGTQAVATAVYLCNHGCSKTDLKDYIEYTFKYNLSMTYDELKKVYGGGYTCPLTVPQALISFLYSNDYEDAIRNAIYLGGDSDTLACITGGIAEAYYKTMPDDITDKSLEKLKTDFVTIYNEFTEKYIK